MWEEPVEKKQIEMSDGVQVAESKKLSVSEQQDSKEEF